MTNGKKKKNVSFSSDTTQSFSPAPQANNGGEAASSSANQIQVEGKEELEPKQEQEAKEKTEAEAKEKAEAEAKEKAEAEAKEKQERERLEQERIAKEEKGKEKEKEKERIAKAEAEAKAKAAKEKAEAEAKEKAKVDDDDRNNQVVLYKPSAPSIYIVDVNKCLNISSSTKLMLPIQSLDLNAQQKIAALLSAIKEMEAEIKELTQANQELKNLIASHDSNALLGLNDVVNKKGLELSKENAQLKSQLQNMTSKTAKAERSEQDLQGDYDALIKTASEAQKQKDDQIDMLKQEIKNANEKNQCLNREKEQLNSVINSMDTELKRHAGRILEQAEEIAKLKNSTHARATLNNTGTPGAVRKPTSGFAISKTNAVLLLLAGASIGAAMYDVCCVKNGVVSQLARQFISRSSDIVTNLSASIPSSQYLDSFVKTSTSIPFRGYAESMLETCKTGFNIAAQGYLNLMDSGSHIVTNCVGYCAQSCSNMVNASTSIVFMIAEYANSAISNMGGIFSQSDIAQSAASIGRDA